MHLWLHFASRLVNLAANSPSAQQRIQMTCSHIRNYAFTFVIKVKKSTDRRIHHLRLLALLSLAPRRMIISIRIKDAQTYVLYLGVDMKAYVRVCTYQSQFLVLLTFRNYIKVVVASRKYFNSYTITKQMANLRVLYKTRIQWYCLKKNKK